MSLVPVPRKPLRANSTRAAVDDRRAAVLGAQALARRRLIVVPESSTGAPIANLVSVH